MFKYKQSSDEGYLIDGFPSRPFRTGCTQAALKHSHTKSSSQGTGGCGGAKRSSPTGGLAKGMPLYEITEPSRLVTPRTGPYFVFIAGFANFLFLLAKAPIRFYVVLQKPISP
jgi:hypothetical protein